MRNNTQSETKTKEESTENEKGSTSRMEKQEKIGTKKGHNNNKKQKNTDDKKRKHSRNSCRNVREERKNSKGIKKQKCKTMRNRRVEYFAYIETYSSFQLVHV